MTERRSYVPIEEVSLERMKLTRTYAIKPRSPLKLKEADQISGRF